MRFFWLALIVAVALAEQPVDVFTSGEKGYFCIKIPYILRTSSNILIAFGEGRIESCSDYAKTDLIFKKSLDNGTTWSELKLLVTNSSETEKNVIGNAAPVQDRTNGRILIPYCRNNREVFLIYSDDDLETWTKPEPIAAGVLPNWKWIGLGPPAGIQLESGRILIPSYHTTLLHENGELSKGHTMLSDDGGKTWRLGATFGGIHFPNECQAVDLGNNTVLINSRGLGTHRLQTISHDGGETFGPVKVMPSLLESWEGCEGSIIRHPSGLLMFSNPYEGGLYRYNMSLLVSSDNGNSWEACKLVDSGASGYSALVVLPDGSVGLLYERSKLKQVIFTPDHITFERVWFPGCNSICGCQ